MNLSVDLQIALSVALSEAARRGHEYAVLEHLLLALTLADEVAPVLRHAGADPDRLRDDLERYLEEEVPVAPVVVGEPRLSLGLQRTLARAGAQVEGSGKEEVQAVDLLVSLFAETDSYAAHLLDDAGVSRLDVVTYLAHGVSKRGFRTGPSHRVETAPAGEPSGDEGEPEDHGADSALEAFAVDLTAQAEAGRIDPLVGRETEVSRMLHVLQRRRKNNPLLVGDPGVGKTALAEGLAVEVAAGRVPEAFREARLYRLDLGALVAGTRYRGDFENRVKAVVAELEDQAETGGPPPVLFIDEIHTLVGAGSAGRGTLDASNLLKPALQSGRLRVIGATTWEELKTFERDAALARRFQKIEVDEPSEDDTVRIFLGLKDRYESHHGVTYTRPAVRAAASLAGRYLRDRRLPDSALDLLDEAGSAVALARRRGASGTGQVRDGDVERVLATMARIPERRVRKDDRERLRDLESELTAGVFGQDEALEQLAAAIQTARAGLREPERPVGSFLLTGPTGVGKTETARELARVLGVPLLRFDMSEYMERHTVSRLVGAPPGYVGYDRGGLLTDAVSKNPHAVLLLDEIEKAHEDVFHLLLQVMDHGTLTDTNGKSVDFRHAVLLMTSNVGAREMARRTPGFLEGTDAGRSSDRDRAVERLFAPEFRNRLDAVLRFEPLSPEVVERIVGKQLDELRERLAERSVTLAASPEAVAWLAREGYDPDLGARPLSRCLERHVRRPLSREILFGDLQDGGTASLLLVDGDLVLDVGNGVAEAGTAEG
jgi:ATP-dependent Clp protease ATP-binding subunit ClpA